MDDYKSGFSGEKLQMRRVCKTDSRQLLAWRNDSKVRQYSRRTDLIADEEHEIWFGRKLQSAPSNSEIFIFSDSNFLVGMSRIDIAEPGRAEVSILVDPGFQGRGYGTRILGQTISHALDEKHLSELEAIIHQRNLASVALFKKFNFVRNYSDGNFDNYALNRGGN